MKPTRRKLLIAVVVVTLLVTMVLWWPEILAFGIYECVSLSEHLQRIPFDSASWQNEKLVNGDDPIRIRMVDDLIRSGRLDHRTRGEVESLLGKPRRTNYFKEYDMVYWLGPERGLISIDSEWLVLKLDHNGIVQNYQIVRD